MISQNIQYPSVRRDSSVTDNYHGVVVEDPYRWMESVKSSEVKQFVKDQNKCFSQYISTYPKADIIKENLKELCYFQRIYEPFKENGYYFQFRNNGTQRQNVLYMGTSLENLIDFGTVFFDPNCFDNNIVLNDVKFSNNGKWMAYSLRSDEENMLKIYFLDVETKQLLPDVLAKVKFSAMSWTSDDTGFFYSSFGNTSSNNDLIECQKMYYHEMGTLQEADEIVIEPDNSFESKSTFTLKY